MAQQNRTSYIVAINIVAHTIVKSRIARPDCRSSPRLRSLPEVPECTANCSGCDLSHRLPKHPLLLFFVWQVLRVATGTAKERFR